GIDDLRKHTACAGKRAAQLRDRPRKGTVNVGEKRGRIKRFSVLAAHRITSTLVLGRLSGSRNLSGHYHRQTLRAMFIFVSIAATFFTTRNEIPSMQLITNSQVVIILSDQDSVAVARKPIARDTAVA